MDRRQPDQDDLLALEETQERPGCQHYWVLEPPKGTVSKGVCRSCGERRDFPNLPRGPQ